MVLPISANRPIQPQTPEASSSNSTSTGSGVKNNQWGFTPGTTPSTSAISLPKPEFTVYAESAIETLTPMTLRESLGNLGTLDNDIHFALSPFLNATSKVMLDKIYNGEYAHRSSDIKNSWAEKGIDCKESSTSDFEAENITVIKTKNNNNVSSKVIILVKDEGKPISEPMQKIDTQLAMINGKTVPLKSVNQIDPNFIASFERDNPGFEGLVSLKGIAGFPASMTALSYDSKWTNSFPVENTKTAPFTLNNNKIIDVDFMTDTRQVKCYSTDLKINGELVKVFALPLEGGGEAIICGPLTHKFTSQKEEGEFHQLINAIVSERQHGTMHKCRVSLPKINITVKNDDLSESHKKYGLGGPIFPTESCTSAANLKMDETGTRSKMVIEQLFSLGSPSKPDKIKELNMNKPFAVFYSNHQQLQATLMCNEPKIG